MVLETTARLIPFLKVIQTVPLAMRSQSHLYWKILLATRVIRFTTAISQTNDPIDANGPVITGLSIPNAPMKIGDIVTLTITVEDDGGDIYPTSGGYGPITASIVLPTHCSSR